MPEHASSTDLTVLQPSARLVRRLNLAQLWEYRELVYFFVWRDLKVRYKQTAIGALWAVLQPLSLMLVFTVFFGVLAKIPSDGIPRPIFFFCGLVPWMFFSQAVVKATGSVVDNRSIITKVFFPRLVLPISSALSFALDLFIGLVLLVGMTFAFGITPGPRALYLPLFAILALLTALVAGIWFSALNARYRDVHYAVGFLVYVWMFASPVAYPSSLVPDAWRPYYLLNPMAAVIDGIRWSLTGAGSPPGLPTAISASIVCVLALIGLAYFRRNESLIVDVV